jgi:hypothetical protein
VILKNHNSILGLHFGFQVSSKSEQFLLCAPNATTKQEWVDAISASIRIMAEKQKVAISLGGTMSTRKFKKEPLKIREGTR